jgi:two-component system sensor histidine kinase BaeS
MPEAAALPEGERSLLLSASQELKTPLTAIRGYAEGLAEGVFTAEEAVDTILVESSRLERLIGDLLDMARIERGCFSARSEPIDLLAVTRAAVARHQGGARKLGIGLAWKGEPLWVVADPAGALQVVSNLVESAIRRAYRPGSLVVVRTGAGRLSVSSTSTGDQPVGPALGVVIAGTLAGAMAGDVSVDSDPSGGTTFTLRLPRAGSAPRLAQA